jgi:hypothetical protein
MPSSVVAGISYQAETGTLRVWFVSGSIYDYKEVPAAVAEALKASSSKGRYLNLQVKGKYDYEKIR